jgi:CubicO group peptidase (beta-lactamase class C family)
MNTRPDPTLSQRLSGLLAEGVDAGIFPSAAAFIAADLEPAAVGFAGDASPNTLWDVASLTKPMVVATLCMRGVAAGWLALDETVPSLGEPNVTIRALLAHRSGLPALCDLPALLDAVQPDWKPGTQETRAASLRHIGQIPRAAGAGHAAPTIYSDLGYIVLAEFLEARLGRRLRDLHVGFGGTAPPADPARFAPGGVCPRRGRRLCGEVDDVNAWALGGAAGHAGLFATLDATAAWALDLARADAGRPATVDGAVVGEFWDLAQRAPIDEGGQPTWVLGFDTPTPGSSSAGSRVSAHAVGHLGFTGSSVWIDRRDRQVFVLLSNRTANGPATQAAMRAFRPRFHDAARELLDRA